MRRLLMIAFGLPLVMTGSAFADDASLHAIAVEYFASQRARQAEVMQRLSQPVDVNFIDTPLSDAIQFLGNAQRITFDIDTNSLADVGISTDDTFTLIRQGVPLRQVLDEILREKIMDLDWCVVGSVVRITTIEGAESVKDVHVYDVSDLLERSSTPFANSYVTHSTDSSLGGAGCGDGTGRSGNGFFMVVCDDVEDQPLALAGNSQAATGDSDESKSATTFDEADELSETQRSTGACSATAYYDFPSMLETIETCFAGTWHSADGESTISPMVVRDRPVLVIRGSRHCHEGVADILQMLRQVGQ